MPIPDSLSLPGVTSLDWNLEQGGTCVPVFGTPHPRRALVAYLPASTAIANPAADYTWSNTGAIRCLVRCLNDLGFTVDHVHFGWHEAQAIRDYDVFVGHPGPAFDALHEQLPKATPRIYLATEAHFAVHQRNAVERAKRCSESTGHTMTPDRPPTGRASSLASAHAIVGTGGTWAASTYGSGQFVKNAAYPDPLFQLTGSTPPGVLYYAGAGPLHKGLDLILEAVAGTDIELHICTALTAQFERAYPNLGDHVYIHGWVPPLSSQLRAIVEHCSFSILGSCSEGSPGSVAQTLHYGLIPLLTRESGCDLPDLALPLEADPHTIRTTFLDACSRPAAWIRERRRQVSTLAATDYTPAAYARNLTAALHCTFQGLGIFGRYG